MTCEDEINSISLIRPWNDRGLKRIGQTLISLSERKPSWPSSGSPSPRSGTPVPFDLPSGKWARELERVDAGSYIEILVSLTSDNKHATAVRRLRKARELIRHNHLEEALGEARKAVEAIRAEDGTSDTVRQARSKTPRDRDQRERWAFLVEDIFSLLSGAAHDDPGTTEHFVWPGRMSCPGDRYRWPAQQALGTEWPVETQSQRCA
jgi:hypothetical protein